MTATNFADQDGHIWMNGQMVPWRAANVHVLSHGLHYASSVFEGERTYGGEVFKLTEHSQRLLDSAGLLGMSVPYTLAEIDAATRHTVTESGLKDAYVRPVIWRGSEMMGISAQANKINLAIACWAWPSYFSPEERMRGIKLKTSDWRRPDPQSAPFKAKAAGLYMICTLSKHAAEAEGFQDALMLDYRGLVAETTGTNIFLVIDGKLVTPTPDCFLDGITRRTVIDLAKRRDLEVIEQPVPVAMLDQATEVLVTGTAAEVTPVSHIDGRAYTPGRITETLMNDYMDLVNRRGPFAAAAE